MPATKVNPLKLRKAEFLSQHHTEAGRYVKRYFFSNGLGASVVCHKDSYGGHAGYFEVAILKYRMGADEWATSEIIYDTQINKDLGCVDVIGWRDFCLLYTSPSPRDKRQSRMPSSA